MKYFLNTKFIEGSQDTGWGFRTKPTIDLISIGIVAEDGREYYAISKDFNLKEAWNRYDKKPNMNYKPSFGGGSDEHYNPQFIKEYWLRENVLKSIEMDLFKMHCKTNTGHKHIEGKGDYRAFKWMLKTYGKSNKQIAKEIVQFVGYKDGNKWLRNSKEGNYITEITSEFNNNGINFYGYYSDYDWVVFCWLFGRMIDLPKGFPIYCIDLKQELDKKALESSIVVRSKSDGFSQRTYKIGDFYKTTFNDMIKYIKEHKDYPKQTNEHNALADAKWNKELYKFLQHD